MYLFQKNKFKTDDSHLVCYIRFTDGELPEVFIIPGSAWLDPNAVLVDKNYVGQKSNPEWGINYSHKNAGLLEPYKAENYFFE